MVFNFRKMNPQEADEIANRWKYSDIYSFYDCTADEEDYSKFMDSDKQGTNFSCYAENELIGFYAIEILDGSIAELGLGLKPEYTGKGLGASFINAVLNHVTLQHGINDFSLSVATFNKRAIKAYEAVGFTKNKVFMQYTNGGYYEFMKMEKRI